jgi:hypothetical protein
MPRLLGGHQRVQKFLEKRNIPYFMVQLEPICSLCTISPYVALFCGENLVGTVRYVTIQKPLPPGEDPIAVK